MSKHKAGDKFIVEIREVVTNEFDKSIYLMKGFNSLTFDDCGLGRLERVEDETAVDWTKVEVDTPILVSENGMDWAKRYFAEYEAGHVYAWHEGTTSWTGDYYTSWKYAKLADS